MSAELVDIRVSHVDEEGLSNSWSMDIDEYREGFVNLNAIVDELVSEGKQSVTITFKTAEAE